LKRVNPTLPKGSSAFTGAAVNLGAYLYLTYFKEGNHDCYCDI
jgi:hypothetical protein